jgi:hypothetical protein
MTELEASLTSRLLSLVDTLGICVARNTRRLAMREDNARLLELAHSALSAASQDCGSAEDLRGQKSQIWASAR